MRRVFKPLGPGSAGVPLPEAPPIVTVLTPLGPATAGGSQNEAPPTLTVFFLPFFRIERNGFVVFGLGLRQGFSCILTMGFRGSSSDDCWLLGESAQRLLADGEGGDFANFSFFGFFLIVLVNDSLLETAKHVFLLYISAGGGDDGLDLGGDRIGKGDGNPDGGGERRRLLPFFPLPGSSGRIVARKWF